MASSPQSTPLPDLSSFLAGTPERVIMSDTPTVTLSWLHANELLSPTTAEELYRTRPDLAPYVNYICGNPYTVQNLPGEGFWQTDLNRSFGEQTLNNPQSYEQHRAEAIREFVAGSEYVLDLHNTVCPDHGKIMIIDERRLHDPKIRKIIGASAIKRILLMSADMAETSLMGESSAKTVAFEYETSLTDSDGVPDMLDSIERLITKRPYEPFEREVYRMQGTILKSEDPGLDVRNFTAYTTDEDGNDRIALFLGTEPRAYRNDNSKPYCGFWATKTKEVL